jgi:hypothetical protein
VRIFLESYHFEKTENETGGYLDGDRLRSYEVDENGSGSYSKMRFLTSGVRIIKLRIELYTMYSSAEKPDGA